MAQRTSRYVSSPDLNRSLGLGAYPTTAAVNPQPPSFPASSGGEGNRGGGTSGGAADSGAANVAVPTSSGKGGGAAAAVPAGGGGVKSTNDRPALQLGLKDSKKITKQRDSELRGDHGPIVPNLITRPL